MQINLIQISEQRFDRLYFPYTAGLLQAYAQQHAQNASELNFRPIIYERLLLEEYDQALLGSDIAGFSVYIWNIQRSLALAQRLKENSPRCLIVFGGPQVPRNAEHFLKQNPWIDLVAIGEGEITFRCIVENAAERRWQDIPGVAWLDMHGNYHQNASEIRMQDLDSIPSPYLRGVFKPLMQKKPQAKWIATWETNRGCPFSCSFCDWGGLIQSRVYSFSNQRLQAEITWFGENQISDLFCADANFGMLKRDPEIVQWMGSAKSKYGSPHLFQTQTAKNIKLRNLEIQRLLAEYGLNPVAAISLQSLNQPTLKAIRRDNISLERYRELQDFCQKHQIFNYTDLIMAMPEETYDSFADGLSSVIQNGQHNHIMFNNAIVLPNAEMGQTEYQKRYGIATAEIIFPGQIVIDDIHERLEIVVATSSLSKQDWIKMQVLAWLTNFLYFRHSTFQPMFLFLFHEYKISFRTQLEWFCLPENIKNLPLLSQIVGTLTEAARILQQGVQSKEKNNLLNVFKEGVHLDPALLIQMEISQSQVWRHLFQESGYLIRSKLTELRLKVPETLFQDVLKMTQANFYTQFYERQTIYRSAHLDLKKQSVYLSYQLADYYQDCLIGSNPVLKQVVNEYIYFGPLVITV